MIASDGYEYETLADRLLGRQKNCPRNKIVTFHRRQGKPEGFVKAWIQGYDSDPEAHHQRCQHNAQVATNSWLHLDRLTRRPSGNGLPAAIQAPAAPVHPAN